MASETSFDKTFTIAFNEPIKQLTFLKNNVTYLDQNLTDEEKANPVIKAKLEALWQKISKMESMLTEMNNAYQKGTNELQALISSFNQE